MKRYYYQKTHGKFITALKWVYADNVKEARTKINKRKPTHGTIIWKGVTE